MVPSQDLTIKGELHLPFFLVQQEKGKGWRLERKRRSGKHVDLEEAKKKKKHRETSMTNRSHKRSHKDCF